LKKEYLNTYECSKNEVYTKHLTNPNITVVSVITDRQETKQIANLKDLQIKVIKLLGEEYEKYYF